jgi:uncharacterized membrane protein YhiD involved in acid resistance
MEIGITILKFALVFVAASLFGLQRQRAHKPIGFGTYIFVAIGGCAAATIALTYPIANQQHIFAAVMTGVGFLGAGALIKTSDKVLGFTSAATVWLFAILGFIIGIGEFVIAVISYALIWLIILIDKYLEGEAIGAYQIKLVIKTCRLLPEREVNKEIMLLTKKHKLMSIDINKKEESMTLNYIIEGSKTELNKLPDKLYSKDWFESAKIE